MFPDRLHGLKSGSDADPGAGQVSRWVRVLLPVVACLLLAVAGLYGGLKSGGVGPWVAFAGFGLCALGFGWQALIDFGVAAPRRVEPPVYSVTVTEDSVSCRPPRGEVESVSWSTLQAVFLEATDGVPVGTLVWRLVGEDGTGCDVPVEAVGSDALLENLQRRLPGFDNEAVIAAMGMLDGVVAVWRRDAKDDTLK